DITTGRKIRALGAKSQTLQTGKTGKTYIVNRDNLMIAEPRFPDNVILQQAVDTEIVRRTRKVSETKAAHYPDYRGVPVDGASMIIWETGWIIISEMDYKEALIPFQRLLNLSLTGIGMLIPLIFFASWLLSRRFIRPIVRLVLADREIIQGDPSRAFISESEIPADELGEVMRIRNIMLASLKQNENAVRESEERYRLLFNSGDDAIFVAQVTADGMPGKFIEINEIACKRLGYTKDELLTMSPADIDAPDMAAQRISALKDLPLKKNIIFEMAHIAKDGKRIPVEINVAYIEYKGWPMYLGIARDITERKDAEDKLKQHVNDLERFRKVTIQREIRMRELKDRVEELEAEIDRLKDTGKTL
ncbi:MAG TPA: PAS domain S-box protein, partial [Candidatus Brocadiaceae bacterium]|nr:PAS domain S-box protein [Candidatus Brocadiaceae bacterium]